MRPLTTTNGDSAILSTQSAPANGETTTLPEAATTSEDLGDPAATRDKRRHLSITSLQQPLPKIHKRKAKHENVSVLYAADGKHKFSTNDVKHLAVKAVTGSSTRPIPLVDLNAAWKVKKTLVVVVPGILPTDFETLPNEEFPQVLALDKSKTNDSPLDFIYSHFDNLIPTSVPGGDDYIHSPLQALMKGPLTAKAKKNRAKELSKVKLVLNDLLLQKNEMKRYGYPLHSEIDSSVDNTLPDGWVETKNFEHGGSHTFALDCEFCQSASGKVLTRVSVVNFQAEVVYDTYVKPAEQITDYVTRYSGITEETLKNETTTLKDVQEKLLSIISSQDILIGHSLESDLNVMRIRHPRVIDTSIVYEHYRGPPFRNALKWLANNFLGRSIQEGEKSGKGHSSVEDLLACLDLVKLKLLKGPDFGAIMEESIFRKILDMKPAAKASIVDYLKEDYLSILKDTKPLEVMLTSVSSDEEAVKNGVMSVDHFTLLIVTLRELEFNSRTRPVPSNYSGKLLAEDNRGTEKATLTKQNREELLKDVNDRLKQLYDSLPSESVMIITTDGGNTTAMNQLRSVKRIFEKHMNEGVEVSTLSKEETWDYDKLVQLHKATGEARKAVSFVVCKA